MKKIAAIVGCNGQDGRLLTSYLQARDYVVIGLGRSDLDIFDSQAVESFLLSSRPDEVYYLAAFHHSSESLPLSEESLWEESMRVHHNGILNFLQIIFAENLKTKIFYASSSHIFEDSQDMQNELTPYCPSSVYSMTKVAGMKVCKDFRDNKRVHVSVGILYNHESVFRSSRFVSRKISSAVARIKLNLEEKVELGDLDVIVDWGSAADYVEAMWKMLQLSYSDEFIISTGIPRSLREFVHIAFASVGLNYKDYVIQRTDIVNRNSMRRIGDFSKLEKATGWKPKTSFEDIIKTMVKNDIEILMKH